MKSVSRGSETVPLPKAITIMHSTLHQHSNPQSSSMWSTINGPSPPTFHLATGGRTFAERGLAYDIPSFRVDGNDFLALYSVTKWARDTRSLQDLAPPTSKSTPTEQAATHHLTTRPPTDLNEEFKCWPGGDPIERLQAHLIKNECG